LFVALKYRNAPHLISLFTGLLLLYSCKPTKYVPDNKYLLNSVKIEVDNKTINENELKGFLKQQPNKRILGFFRFHLGMYNLSNLQKDKGFNKYLRTIGEAPIIWNSFSNSSTIKQLKIYLQEKGYQNSYIYDSTHLHKKKADVMYFVRANEPLRIQSLKYNIEDTALRRIVYSDTINSLITSSKEKIASKALIDSEKGRINLFLKNSGYYNFSVYNIDFVADSSANYADLVMTIKPNSVKINNIFTAIPYKQYKINQVEISTENTPEFKANSIANNVNRDTILLNGLKFIYQENFWVRPNVILQSNYILPGNIYRISNVEETKKQLNSLNVFSFINIQFTELPASDTSEFGYLNCTIKLTPNKIQSFELAPEITNSSGNIGGAFNFIYQHKSLFGNAEVFNLKWKGAIEAVRKKNESQWYKALEYGVEGNINIPKFLLPGNSIWFIKKYNPKTSITVAYNYQQRPDFTRAVANIAFGYKWKQSRFQNHSLNPIELNFVQILDSTAEFNNDIKDTYLQYSYTDHLVSVTSYSYEFSNQNLNKTTDFKYFRLNLESAGTILSLYNKLIGASKKDDYYTLFGIRYSQYVRGDIDYRYYQILNKGNSLVYRIFAGIGYPFGNAIAIPFEKRYFVGGANSIRGWQARSLGPGNYRDTSLTVKFPNYTGDIKLEANIEYRFKLFWLLEGALFADIGNIWAITKNDERPGALFKFDTFYKDLAVGSGLGLRFDLKFFIFRTDLGLKMRDPSRDVGNRWIFTHKSIIAKDFALNLAISYPF
jgi:outer membrane protein assembly factor BamA